jgi:hypothetical protein
MSILKNQIQFTRNKSANTSHQRHLLDKGDTVSICFNIDVHPCIKGGIPLRFFLRDNGLLMLIVMRIDHSIDYLLTMYGCRFILNLIFIDNNHQHNS